MAGGMIGSLVGELARASVRVRQFSRWQTNILVSSSQEHHRISGLDGTVLIDEPSVPAIQVMLT